MNVDYTPHAISPGNHGRLHIDGFQNVDVDACFCIVAYGNRYHEYGIADNSLLFCCKTSPIQDGDLVIAFDGNTPTLYLYRKDKSITKDGEKRILHNRKRIHGKVLGSFSFYH